MEASAVAAETSLSPILEMTSHEREARASLLESLDSRAGVPLGFAAALAALAPRGVNMVVEGGRIVAVLGGLAAGPVWKTSSLKRFLDSWERKPGRPRRTVT
jgi:hypothetical protein